MASDPTDSTLTADESTSRIGLPPRTVLAAAAGTHDALISRDSWVRIILWVIPIIFTAGALYVSVQALGARQDDQEARLKAEEAKSARIEADVRIMQSTVQAISAQQDRLVGRVEAINDKLNDLKATLGAIGERVGARPVPSRDDRLVVVP